jgi:hypothetical protein
MSHSDYHIKFQNSHGSQKNPGYAFLVTMTEKFSWARSRSSKFLVLVHAVADGFTIRKRPFSSHFVYRCKIKFTQNRQIQILSTEFAILIFLIK